RRARRRARRPIPPALGAARLHAVARAPRRARAGPLARAEASAARRLMNVWVDMTASAHVLVFRPLIRILRERGDHVEITARDYAQTLQLLELHGIDADVIGKHGGRSRARKLRSLQSRLHALRSWA